jgi:hypothetical protein
MVRYRYQDPDGTHTLSRAEVLAQYFEWWSEQMRKAGKEDLISEEACIEDFIVVHWAEVVRDR